MSAPGPAPELSTPALPAALFWARFHLARNLRRRAFLLWALGLTVAIAALRLFGAPARVLQQLALVYLTPLLGLFFGSGVLREEIEDQTLTYAFTRPVRRAWLYIARVLAAAGPALALAVFVAAASAGSLGAAPRLAGAALIGVLAYTCLFAAIGLRSRGSTWIGLGLFLVWELGVGAVPGFLGRLTLVTHVRSLAGVGLEGGVLGRLWEPVAWPISLAALVGVTALCLALGGRWVDRREFPLAR